MGGEEGKISVVHCRWGREKSGYSLYSAVELGGTGELDLEKRER